MKRLLIKDLLLSISQLKEDCTLLGIGPMSQAVVIAAIESAKESDYPLFFIASRNQVDSRHLGGGYVMNWDQRTFADFVNYQIRKQDFNGLCYLCRDHGGPWQNDRDYENKLLFDESMDSALESFYHDLESGFSLFHIDTSKDPLIKGVVPVKKAVERGAWFVERIEEKRKSLNFPPVDYEVSIEETSGKYSTEAEFRDFIENLLTVFKEKELPVPSLIVGQTGTLTRMMENAGKFDIETVKQLVSISKEKRLAFKEHNTDYLEEKYLKMHPRLGIAMANVAPEFGKTETEILLQFAKEEENLFKKHKSSLINPSQFFKTLETKVLNSGKWKKWLPVSFADNPLEFLANADNREALVRVNGHYFFNDKNIIEAKTRLFSNLKEYNVVPDPERLIIEKLKLVINKYVNSFNLKGLTSKIKEFKVSA